MALRILIDENTSPKLVSHLKKEGIESTHVVESVGSGSSDREIATYAEANNYAVLTHDIDFLTSEYADSIRVLYYTDDTATIGDLSSQITAIDNRVESNSDLGSVTYLSDW